jgi:hypothetical protein
MQKKHCCTSSGRRTLSLFSAAALTLTTALCSLQGGARCRRTGTHGYRGGYRQTGRNRSRQGKSAARWSDFFFQAGWSGSTSLFPGHKFALCRGMTDMHGRCGVMRFPATQRISPMRYCRMRPTPTPTHGTTPDTVVVCNLDADRAREATRRSLTTPITPSTGDSTPLHTAHTQTLCGTLCAVSLCVRACFNAALFPPFAVQVPS